MHHKSWFKCHQEPSSGAMPSHSRKVKASVGAVAHIMLRGSTGQHTETDTQRQLTQDRHMGDTSTHTNLNTQMWSRKHTGSWTQGQGHVSFLRPRKEEKTHMGCTQGHHAISSHNPEGMEVGGEHEKGKVRPSGASVASIKAPCCPEGRQPCLSLGSNVHMATRYLTVHYSQWRLLEGISC